MRRPHRSVLLQSFLLPLFTLLLACNKEGLDHTRNILVSHKWYLFQGREITYRAIESGPYTILKDTTYVTDPCQYQSKYEFKSGGVLRFTNKCFATPINYEGQWDLIGDNHLLGWIPDVINGQTYYFGFDGIITEIDKSYFKIQSTRVFGFTSCSNTGPCQNIKDSTIYEYIYKN